jgi:hypothetical protein
MIKSDKQARLSAALLAGKKAAGSPAQPFPVSDKTQASFVDARVANGREEAGGVALADPPELPESLLVSKGAASAAGFKPSYWSYEPQGARPPEIQQTAPDAAMSGHAHGLAKTAIGQLASKRLAQLALIAFGGAALLFWTNPFSRIEPAPPPPPVPAVAAPAAIPKIEPAVVVTPKNDPPPKQDSAELATRREIENLLDRGDDLISTGDVVSARLFYERAAAKGDGRAALLMGQTFDPTYLRRIGVFGVRGDPAEAANWYRRARDLGEVLAESRLIGLETK